MKQSVADRLELEFYESLRLWNGAVARRMQKYDDS